MGTGDYGDRLFVPHEGERFAHAAQVTDGEADAGAFPLGLRVGDAGEGEVGFVEAARDVERGGVDVRGVDGAFAFGGGERAFDVELVGQEKGFAGVGVSFFLLEGFCADGGGGGDPFLGFDFVGVGDDEDGADDALRAAPGGGDGGDGFVVTGLAFVERVAHERERDEQEQREEADGDDFEKQRAAVEPVAQGAHDRRGGRGLRLEERRRRWCGRRCGVHAPECARGL